MDDKGWPGDLMGYCLKPMKGFVYILFVIKKRETYTYLWKRKESSRKRETEVQKRTNDQET